MVVLDLVWTTDPGMSSTVENGEEVFKKGENMVDAVKQSVAQELDLSFNILTFYQISWMCSFHKIKRKLSKYCLMGLKMQPTFA